ncbi:hypothetical protein ACJRO7_026810 [Eucalyptus globulus]|uniref:Splicing factor subunit n=1 Tax=Eucalyptus globulus TaxID=34317 RepID=A0ABD3JQ66_EUCGL
MQASDRFNINSQLEHLQAKYVGSGHADLNRFEWAVNIQRDSFAVQNLYSTEKAYIQENIPRLIPRRDETETLKHHGNATVPFLRFFTTPLLPLPLPIGFLSNF